ncbi:MAG: hypothetical protein COA95_01100 [Methylophaga sp.]|nr:MAG: hypothetical protein COA95_01100 [Methylophaga sp.]
MIVAITGASGFIGKKLALKHIALGDQVRFLTRNRNSLNMLSGAIGFLGDITVPSENIHKFIQGADVLYHLAAEISDENIMWRVNVDGTRNLLNLAEGKIGCWVQLSSTGVYGQPDKGVITEESVLNPYNPYEVSKAEADKLVFEFCKQNNIAGCILRPSNVFGPEMPNQSLFQLINIIDKGLFLFVGDKGAIANYIYVDNVIDALICCSKDLPYKSKEFSSYIISDYCTMEKMVEVIALSLDKEPPRLRLPKGPLRALALIAEKVPGIPLKRSRIDAITSRVIYSHQQLQDVYGFCNQVSIEDGFRALVAEWKKPNG